VERGVKKLFKKILIALVFIFLFVSVWAGATPSQPDANGTANIGVSAEVNSRISTAKLSADVYAGTCVSAEGKATK